MIAPRPYPILSGNNDRAEPVLSLVTYLDFEKLVSRLAVLD